MTPLLTHIVDFRFSIFDFVPRWSASNPKSNIVVVG